MQADCSTAETAACRSEFLLEMQMAEMSNGLALHSTVSLIKQPEIISTANIFLSDNNITISDITFSPLYIHPFLKRENFSVSV